MQQSLFSAKKTGTLAFVALRPSECEEFSRKGLKNISSRQRARFAVPFEKMRHTPRLDSMPGSGGRKNPWCDCSTARVHLSDVVKAEYVNMAFDLQVNSLRRVERENIDLSPEVVEEEGGHAPTEPQDGEAAEAAAAEVAARQRKVRITYAEYQRIGQMLAAQLARSEDTGDEVTEEDLVAWYMEQVEEQIETEAMLMEQQHLVQLIINRLIDKDRVIIVYRPSEDAMKPEQRVLVKHPNFPVGEVITRQEKS